MGQELFKAHSEICDRIKTDDTTVKCDTILSENDVNDISFFFPLKSSNSTTTTSFVPASDNAISSPETIFTKKIQNQLGLLTKLVTLKEIDSQINEALVNNVDLFMENCNKETIKQIVDTIENQQRLQTSLANKLQEEKYGDLSIFAQPFIETEIDNKDDQQLKKDKQNQRKAQQLYFFGIQSLSSILLILIKSAEKNDPAIIQQILTLTSHLCEQIPMKCLSSSNNSNYLFKSLSPLTNYINALSRSNDPVISKQAVRILLSFSIAKASLKDILPLLSKLIFDTVDVYNVQGLFLQMNNGLTEAINEREEENRLPESDRNEDNPTTPKETADAIIFLKSAGTYPNSQLMNIDGKLLTGQFISSIILTHIDLDNELYSNNQLKRGSVDSSFSLEFHPDTFRQLFNIIEQLMTEHSSTIVIRVLTICLRLATTHLRFLRAVRSNLDRDLLTTNNELKKSVSHLSSDSNSNIDLTTFLTDDELTKWFQLLLKLACNEEQMTISKEASKALVYLIHQRTSSFTEKLLFMHKYIVENQRPTLIEEFLIEMNRIETQLSWIEVLDDSINNGSDKTTAFKILFSFIDIYFNPSSEMNNEQKQQIQKILLLFQQLLLHRLMLRSSNNENDFTSSLINQYVTYIFKKSISQTIIINDLFNSLLVGLCFMTKTTEYFHFAVVRSTFASVMPLLAEYLLQNTISEENGNSNQRLICWLLGKINNILLSASPLDALEIKYVDKLKLNIFSGGCEKLLIEKSEYLLDLFNSNLAVYGHFQLVNQAEESSSNKEFLMSIYNNTGEGAQLISKMKMCAKNKERFLQKSIEQQTNDLCAAVFAVYIKHYRRIDLAKTELSRTDQGKANHQLLSIYEYANHVQTLFATIKAQGGDCNELYEQIKTNTLFLLLSVKESDLIPIIEDDLPHMVTEIPQQKDVKFQRQVSRWSKAKSVIRLLKNLMKACIRFKKLMLKKRQAAEQKYDYESTLHRAIGSFIYGNFNKVSTSTISEIKELKLDELEKCLCRQYERGMTRLITYRFSQAFIQNVCVMKDQNQALMILTLYLPHLRCSLLEWSYLENIPAVNSQLKEEIRKTYYSIIKIVLSYITQTASFQSKILVQNMFYLLNLSYDSSDICHLYNHQFAEILFTSLVSFVENAESSVSMDLKFTAFNWFRLFLFKLCENIDIERLRGTSNQLLQQQVQLVFNKLILNELRALQILSIDTTDKMNDCSVECEHDSLKNLDISWFLQAATKDISNRFSSKLEIDLCRNQYLIFILRCVHFYEHVRSACATVDYIEELLHIYHHTKHNATSLLTLKILRQLIPFLPESIDGKSGVLIEKFLVELLLSIGESFSSQQTTPEIVTELIYIYRTIMSINSSWQMMAAQLIFDCIKSYLNLQSIETNDQNQMNHLLASLCVIGGYIQPFCLSSIVKVSLDQQINDEVQLATIIEIDRNILHLNTSDTSPPYLIQYLQTNQTKSVTVDQLQLEIDVLPPNLLLLPNTSDSNATIDSVLDVLGYFIQTDTSTSESLLLLQLKRCSISALYHLLNNQKLVEMFMQKPYASIIAQLCISDLLSNTRRHPDDIRLLNKQHLEQLCLSLDTCERLKEIVEDDEHEKKTNTFADLRTANNPLIVNTLSTSVWNYSGWKPYASKTELQSFTKGRIGSRDISIVATPSTAADMRALQECGNKHKFKGRISPNAENTHVGLPTFIVDNLQVTEGKWYYCVRLPNDGVQIGWATNGFVPGVSCRGGIGDDQYSWSYDGSRDYLLSESTYSGRFNDVRWKEKDVCGCGIEIDGDNTNIKYWLNGKYLGMAFKHQANIGLSSTPCNLLPNEANTTFFPGVTLQFESYPSTYCELIFNPEDMQECPLPAGYKPLIIPKLIDIENSIVAYPYSAYLVRDDSQDYFYKSRTTTATNLLRDFVNEHHIHIDFTLEEHHLILPNNSAGFPLSIENDAPSFTITFDFQVLPTVDGEKNEELDIELLTLDGAAKTFSIRIPSESIKKKTRTVIILRPKEQQTKVYINNACQTFETSFQNETMTKFHFHLLPKIAAAISNVALWKYALPEEQIERLFTYGLFYVAADYQQLKEHRKRDNIFTLKQSEFQSELLVPFDQPFEQSIWEKKKTESDHDESKYFTTNDPLAIQLFGNKTYLVLDKTTDRWFEYTLILDISIPNWPIANEQLTLIGLNKSSRLFINHDGQLCLLSDEKNVESQSKVNLNEYFRLWICVRDHSAKIYINGTLEIDSSNNDDRFHATSNRFDLFREADLTKNTTSDDTLRIECQSITCLNRSITIDETMAQPNVSLESLFIMPSFSIIAPSLIAIGYKKEWILSVMNQYKTTHIQMIDTLIREQKEQFLKEDLENEQKRCLMVFSRLSPTIDQNKLKDLIEVSKIDIPEKISTVGQLVLTHWNDLQTLSNVNPVEETSDENGGGAVENKWFRQSIRGLPINDNINEWMRDESQAMSASDATCQLLDLSHLKQEQQTSSIIQDQQKLLQKSIESSHQNKSRKQYLKSRIGCENRLTAVYARYTILNMLKVWSTDTLHLFPLEKFGDCIFLVTLSRLMDYHYTYTSTYTDEKIDQMSLSINSILKAEMKQLFKHTTMQNGMTGEILQNQTPLLFHLQKDVVVQMVRFLIEPSLISEYSIVDEQKMIKEPSLHFVFKTLNLFVELIKDKSMMKQEQIESIVSLLFPVSIINLIFDLFLVVRTHQSKFFLLHLFSTLIQASKTFHLTDAIQNFLIKLLAELSSESTSTKNRLSKNFEMAVKDLVFLLLLKQKNEPIEQQKPEHQSQLTALPEDVRNLFTALDVINMLTDKTKKTLLLQTFFAQSKDLLGSGFRLNEDEFRKSDNYFDITADQQLMTLMNKESLNEYSFPTFLRSLPTESTENSTFYKNYPSLLNIPADCIQIRVKFIYQFNEFIKKILVLIDFSALPEVSYITDKIRTVTFYLLYYTKYQLFDNCIDRTNSDYESDWTKVYFDTVKATAENENNENTMFHQAYQQLQANAQITFRRPNEQVWHAEYVGMHSTDAGGPYRDSITRICWDLCSSRVSLFILCPNGRTNSGLNRDCWIPNVFPPNKPIPNKFKKQYRFIGQLMGFAIRKKHYLDLKFPLLLWKQLLREQITVEDIQAIDMQSFTMIDEMEKNVEQTKSLDADTDINYVFSSIMSELKFDVVSSGGQTYELVPGGMEMPITAANFKQYCSSYREYRLNEFSRQIEFIRQGLHSIVPSYYLCLFTARELEEAVCGKGEIDVELLKRNTNYEFRYNQDSPIIQRFWTVFTEMFTDEQRKLFLTFVWGRNTLPRTNEEFQCKFSITKFDVEDGQVDRTLPRSHTCYFTIDIPEYSTTEIMYERLNYAITYCSYIDGDGNMNETPDVINATVDSSPEEQ